MAIPVIQPSFASGEISPSLYGRVDLAKFHSGAALMRNFFADYRGGASNRPGTAFVGRCLPGINRLIPFTFSIVQTYALVFSNLAMRVVMNGALVLEPSFAITGVSQASPVNVSSTSVVGYVPGDWVYIAGIVPANHPLNGNYYQILTESDHSGLTLKDLDGNIVDSTNYPAYTSGGTVSRVYTLASPYAASDLALVKFVQSADTMTLCHPSYPTYQLTRTGHAAWTIAAANFVPTSASPGAGAAIQNAAASGGSTSYNYVVTAIAANGVTESLPSQTMTVTGCKPMSTTSGAAITVAWSAVPGAQYYNVYRQAEVISGSALSGQLYGFIGTCTKNSFVDQNILPDFTHTPPQNYNPFSGANNYPACTTYYQGRQCFSGSNSAPDTIFMSKSGDFLNMGYATPSQQSDSIVAPIVARQVNPIKHMVPMDALIALSASGAFKVDAGSQGGSVTPSAISAVPQAYNGCSDVPPITINQDILYVQSKGSIVRDLAYNFYAKVYTGSDLTVLSNHLFFGHLISEWAWAEEPMKIIWCVREDGVLLSFTFLKEQDIYAWAWHDTDGQFKSVCSVAEGAEDAVYLIVNRQVGGSYKQFIERMASRKMGSVPERGVPPDFTAWWFVDCGLQAPLTRPNANITPSASSGMLQPVGATIVSGGATYSAQTYLVVSDITGQGVKLVPTIVGGKITAVTKTANASTAYTQPTITAVDPTGAGTGAILAPIMSRDVTITADAPIFTTTQPGDLFTGNGGYGYVRVVNSTSQITVDLWQSIATVFPIAPGYWSCTTPVSKVTGLTHLAGKTVAVLADGSVQTNKVVAADGSVTLDQPASAIVVGLPYTAQLRSLYTDIPGEPTVQGRRKNIPAVTVRVQDTRGLKVGNLVDPLKEIKQRNKEIMGAPITAFTGDQRIIIPSNSTVPGQVLVQQDYPLPATVLALIPEVEVGDTVSA